MQDFFEKYDRILTSAGLKIFLMKVYVDDGRQVSTKFSKGMTFSKEHGNLTWNKEAEMEDVRKEEEGEKKNAFMARVCLDAMNSINPDLTFTAEVEEEFDNKRLPTLDFSLWMNKK